MATIRFVKYPPRRSSLGAYVLRRPAGSERVAKPRPSRSSRKARRGLGSLAALTASVLVVSACLWPPGADVDPVVAAALGGGSVAGRIPNVVPDGESSSVLRDRVYVEAGARLAADGVVEVGALVNATGLLWQPQQRRFYYHTALIGDWWTSTPIGPAEAGVSTVRIRARKLGDGRIELALQTPSGEMVLPRISDLVHRELAPDDWTYTTPVVLTSDGERPPAALNEGSASEQFTAISVRERNTCGLQANGSIQCWGQNFLGEARPLPGDFTLIDDQCAIRTDGTLACWTDYPDLPTGPFVDVSGRCGLRPDGRVECWDSPYPPPEGAFQAITGGTTYPPFYYCGIRVDGTAACWGQSETPEYAGAIVLPFARSGWADPPPGRFTNLAAGVRHTCGIRLRGAVECWGDNAWGQSAAPSGPFRTLSAGTGHTCGLRPDGRVECWGGHPRPTHWEDIPPEYPEHNVATAPPGRFVAIDSGEQRTCGLRDDGDVECWSPEFHEAGAEVLFDYSKERWDGRWKRYFATSHLPAGIFVSIGVGGRHACGLRNDGNVACWGDDLQEQATEPADTLGSLAAGGWHTCGIRTDGGITCWGDDSHSQTSAPAGAFTRVTAGWEHNCALRADRSAVCWGSNADGQRSAPTSTFDAVEAGGRHTCGIQTDGGTTCWGSNSHGQAEPPTGEYLAITAGALHTCGLRPGGRAVCWGDDRFGQSGAPDGMFESIGAGADYTCALDIAGDIKCWGGEHEHWHRWSDIDATHYPPPAPPPPGPFVALEAGSQIACGLRADGSSECWIATGLRTFETAPSLNATDAPRGTFSAVAAGAYHTCALRTDGSVACWGENSRAQATPSPGVYVAISAGKRHTCALATDNALTCWGDNTFGQADIPVGEFTSVSAGTRHTCGINVNSELTCWGNNSYGQASPPLGLHRAVAAGERHTCAIAWDHTIGCWGDNNVGQTAPPDGLYSTITAGRFHTCATQTDGSTKCWGLGFGADGTLSGDGEPAVIPEGVFQDISAGTRHTCGIRPDGSVQCWPQSGEAGGRYGLDSYDYDWDFWNDPRATPLPGPFTAISAGTYHTCGIRPDGTIDCWSGNEPRYQ